MKLNKETFSFFKYLNNVFQNSEIDFIVSVLTFMKPTGLKAYVLLWLYIKATIHTSWMQKARPFYPIHGLGYLRFNFSTKNLNFTVCKGISPECLEIKRPTSQKASSCLSKAIAILFFFFNVQIKHAKEAVRSESSFLLHATQNVAKKMRQAHHGYLCRW
jgi:hypothetical protein